METTDENNAETTALHALETSVQPAEITSDTLPMPDNGLAQDCPTGDTTVAEEPFVTPTDSAEKQVESKAPDSAKTDVDGKEKLSLWELMRGQRTAPRSSANSRVLSNPRQSVWNID